MGELGIEARPRERPNHNSCASGLKPAKRVREMLRGGQAWELGSLLALPRCLGTDLDTIVVNTGKAT